MNKILELKGEFLPDVNHVHGGGSSMLVDGVLSKQHISDLISELESILTLWDKKAPIKNILVDVKYIKLVSKSNRISRIFSYDTDVKDPNDIVVGAKFSDDIKTTHIITYYISQENLTKTINFLKLCLRYVNEFYGDYVVGRNFNENSTREEDVSKFDGLSKSALRELVCDSFYVDSFSIPSNKITEEKKQLVTFYKTEEKLSVIFSKLNLDLRETNCQFVDEYYSALLSIENIQKIINQAPYLIANSTSDLIEELEKTVGLNNFAKSIPDPKDEPIIGVIDGPFDESVYFSKWVDNHNFVGNLDKNKLDHGTKVSSLIVDAEALNPGIKDDCGRFRVRHFGVFDSENRSSLFVMNLIKKIVKENPDIHVWNLSLGGIEEINNSFISYEASILDELQHENNCVFVVCGTNDRKPIKGIIKRIAPPADSLNSLVVNSVKADKTKCSYSRMGPVLKYFLKPDVSYFGGDLGQELCACSPESSSDIFSGTSASAPLIARKLAFLIEKMNFPREIAKALIIHDAAGWNYNKNDNNRFIKGYGVVSNSIKKLLEVNDDEIRFYITGKTLAYKTYNYKLPIPKNTDGKYPFISKATLCYFPKCYRNQGVDYTETELDLSFGRVKPDGKIEKIEGSPGLKKGSLEKELRDISQKWDNTKHKMTIIKSTNEPLKAYPNLDWGIEIIRSERIVKDDSPVNFGMVVTLKSTDGINRFNEFVRLCSLKSWIVHPIEIDTRIEIHEIAKEEIDLE